MNRRSSMAALALLVLAVVPLPADAQGSCLVTPQGNGSGWNPPPNAASLPSTTPRPGPDVLYWPAPRAPQLENSGGWQAEPILVSGTSAYRAGEFVYQDFVYDEASLAYPDEPERYGGNAADLVEVRLRLDDEGLAIRLTYNTLLDPDVAATTIALGSSDAPAAMPHGAGAAMPAEVFVTVHGCGGDVVSAADGATVDQALEVAIDVERRQVEVTVPYAAFDPRARETFRVAAAAGLWDPAAGAYLRPDPELPAFFNVAFRFDEPFVDFRNGGQNAALATGDLSAFFADVDVAKLTSGVHDDLADEPTGVPFDGRMSRIYPSHFETRQGLGDPSAAPVYPGYQPCHAPCAPPLAGQLQPYSLSVPPRSAPVEGWGLTFFHHGSSENYNDFLDRAERFAELDGGSSITVTTEARGPQVWEFEQAGADLFEVWADVARWYPLDPDRATLSGQSLGGYATFKNAVQFPDLWSAVNPHIGPPTASGAYVGRPAPPPAGEGTLVYDLLPSLRHVPVVYWVGQQDEAVPYGGTQQAADILGQLQYRHSFRAFAGEHATTGLFLANYDPQGDYLADRTVERDPAHVTYVFSGFMNQPDYGLTSDHAYWLSGLTLRDDSGEAPLGTIDVVSHGLGVGDAPPGELVRSTGLYPTSFGGAPVSYIGQDLEWGPVPIAPVDDVLEITATNLSSVTVHVDRAGLSCSPRIEVQSDGPLEVKLAGCEATVERLAGPGRVETSVAAAEALFPDGADDAVVAAADRFSDALAAGPAAALGGGPVLLTPGDALPEDVAGELRRLAPDRILIAGGSAAVSDAVEAQLAAIAPVVRLAGNDRFDTAATISRAMFAPGAAVAYIASGETFPDALAAAAAAGRAGAPVLLTRAEVLPEVTAAELSRLAPGRIVVVGGPTAVSDAVEDRLDAFGPTERLAGGDRYGTAAAVAAATSNDPRGAVVLATGQDFPDALTGAAAAASLDAPVLLVTRDAVPASTADELARLDPTRIVALGGTAAISEDALAAAAL